MPRLLVAFGVVLLAAGLSPLRADEFPWCVELDVFTKNCAFASHDECAAIAKNGGGACLRNPRYQPAAAAAPAKPKSAKTSSKPQ